MLSVKVTAILLITAIINPLCCCLDLSANPNDRPFEPSALHACCDASSDNDVGSEQKSIVDCPHQTERISKISEAPSDHSSIAKPLLPLFCYFLALDFQFGKASREVASETLDPSPQIPPSSSVTQSYCVYLL